MATRANPREDMDLLYLSVGVVAFSVIAIIAFVYGYSDAFYLLAVIAIVLGFYMLRRLSVQKEEQVERKTPRQR
jgi:4-hydroxybenzoate polyprenyltransferase